MKNKIFWLNEEEFIKRLDTFPYAEATKVNIKNAYLNFIDFMIRKKYVTDFNTPSIDGEKLDEIVENFINEKDTFGLKSVYRNSLRPIFILHNLEFNIEKYPIINYAEFEDYSERFLTKEELINEIQFVYNESDKLLLYMAYLNLCGDDLTNISYAKIEDINFNTKEWKLYDGQVVDFKNDSLLEQLLKNTINQTEYIPYIKINALYEYVPTSYKYNENCIYLFKTRKHPRSNDGLTPLLKEGIKKTYTRLTLEFGKMFRRNNLKISGMLNVMYEIKPSPKWTIKEITKLKKELGFKGTETDIKIFYLQKYFPEYLLEINKSKQKNNV